MDHRSTATNSNNSTTITTFFFLVFLGAIIISSSSSVQAQFHDINNNPNQNPAVSLGGGAPHLSENYIPIMHSALGHKNPEFDRRIKNVTVNVGREAVLECRVNHLGRYKVGWMKAQDQTILALHKRVITHNQRITVDHEENKIWKLKIRAVEEEDRGCYMCQINTEEMKKQIGCIDVLIPPDIDDLRTSSDVTVNEGSDATLRCNAKGHPKPRIVWLREDKSQFPAFDPQSNKSRRTMVTRYEGESLFMRKIQRSQMGAYLCIASNDVPPAVSKRVSLNVNFRPEISIPSQLYGVAPGTDVTLKCIVQAFPWAISYWTKEIKNVDDAMGPLADDKMLMDMNGNKYNMTEERVNQFEKVVYLTIKNWTPDDEGYFVCSATNSLGKADGKIQTYTFIPSSDSSSEDEDEEEELEDEEDEEDYETRPTQRDYASYDSTDMSKGDYYSIEEKNRKRGEWIEHHRRERRRKSEERRRKKAKERSRGGFLSSRGSKSATTQLQNIIIMINIIPSIINLFNL